jgi:NAD(P)-dependent dehydrogenase (short-subunit alcohol dehydrogenase family)
MSNMQVDGKVVFVTGAARGIGLDAAQRLHSLGATVVLVDIDEASVKKEAGHLGARALGLHGDVTDRAQLDATVAQVIATFGRVDVVIANAGIAPPVESVRTGREEAFDRVLDVNLHGVVNTVRATLPSLLETGGYLLVISSLYAVVNGALSAPYAMSKTAVEALGRSLRVELAGAGVDVGVAYFGFIDTKLIRDSIEKPGIPELRSSLPGFITKVVPVERAGTAIANGVATRAARITAPKWIGLTLPLRGLIQYLDGTMAKQRRVRSAIDAAEAASRG